MDVDELALARARHAPGRKPRWGDRRFRRGRGHLWNRAPREWRGQPVRTIVRAHDFGVDEHGEPGWREDVVQVSRRLDDGRVASLTIQLFGLLVTVSTRKEWPHSWSHGWQYPAAASGEAVRCFEAIGDGGYLPRGYAKCWNADGLGGLPPPPAPVRRRWR